MTGPGEPPRLGIRHVLGHPGYRRLWAARTVSQWGDTFNFVALALLIYRLTGSGVGVTGVVVAEIAGVLLVAPWAGPVIDRHSRVRIMVTADLARMTLCLVLALAHTHVVVVYAVAFGLSAGSAFFNPAAGSLLPALVDSDELVAANSGIWTAAVLSQIALAPIAGLLVTTAGVGIAFALNAASFAVSAAVLANLPTVRPPGAVPRRRLLAESRDGLALVGGDRLLRALATGQLLAALSAGATSALLVVLAVRHLRLAPSGYGLLIAAIGIGAALGPLVLLRLAKDARRPVWVFGPYALRGLVDLLLAATTALPVAMAALAVYGLGTSTGTVSFNSLLQTHTPEPMRGRVFATMDVLWQTGRLVSLGIGGYLADAIGISAVFYLGGGLLLVAGLVGLAAVRGGPPPAC
ncbi:MAG: MFS transporter [Mycobacteriales bacterium]